MQTSTRAEAGGPLRPHHVVIASHREILARGLVAMLADHPEEVLVSLAPSLRGVAPGVDVVLYDLALLDDSGPTPLQDLVRTSGGRVIGLAEVVDSAQRNVAERYGVAGCLPIQIRGRELLAAIAAVAAGGQLPRPACEPGVHTPREAEIMALIVQGLSNEEIARRLGISLNTLKSHIRQAYRKIGATTRAQAVAWATQHGIA